MVGIGSSMALELVLRLFVGISLCKAGPRTTLPYSSSMLSPMTISTEYRGSLYTNDFAIYFRNEDGPISPFHDIPLYYDHTENIFNMVVEVPRWTNAKMEIMTKERLNPIMQDTKDDNLRFVANVFPQHGYMWNYGALPQTWEDPNHTDEHTGLSGDNDPIDICEIGQRVAKMGDVIQVKILGVIGLLDEGETDWKLIAIDVNDPLAPQLDDIEDVDRLMPGYLDATVEWFRIYKVPSGSAPNEFAFDGNAQNRDFAHEVILSTYDLWKRFVHGINDGGELDGGSVLVPLAANKITVADAENIVSASPEPGPAASVDPEVDLWHFVN